jgi:hypothetical protein
MHIEKCSVLQDETALPSQLIKMSPVMSPALFIPRAVVMLAPG